MRTRVVILLVLIVGAFGCSFGSIQQSAQSGSVQPGAETGSVNPSSQGVSAKVAPGKETIAFVVSNDTSGDQIWLIEPDGRNKKKIYSIGAPDTYAIHYITSLAWRPDAGELIFTSNHEEYCSWYTYDVYAILPDGSGYRRVTNGPACAGLAAYPQGKVTLNTSGSFGYQVYVQGAPEIKFANGSTVTFDHVADFGNSVQPIVTINGGYRWMGPAVDVKAGQTVSDRAAVYTSGTDEIGAFNPVWKSDGSRIGYAFGCAQLLGIVDQAKAGDFGQPLLDAKGVTPCLMAWGPNRDTANNILYWNDTGEPGIYVTKEKGGVGTRVIEMQGWDKVFQIQYLPDASGFIYTFVNSSTSSDVYRYDFASDTITQLTQLSHEYARNFSISPDGQSIVFERAAEELMAVFGGASDLWIMGIDGSNPQLLVKGGGHPSWSAR